MDKTSTFPGGIVRQGVFTTLPTTPTGTGSRLYGQVGGVLRLIAHGFA